jgi:DNA-binding MarR family transcriptional regulator
MSKRPGKPEPHAARAGRAAPAAIAAECLALRARVLNRAISSIYDRALARHELKVSQFNLLVAISGHPGVLASRLVEALCIDESTLSRNLERLRKRGWIEIEASADSRSRPLRMTAVGRAEFERACGSWRRAQDEALGQLGANDAAALVRIAGRYLSA